MRVVAGVLLALAALAGVAQAQRATTTVRTPAASEALDVAGTAAPDIGLTGGYLPGTVDAESYIVGPGDGFRLNLSGRVTRTVFLAVGPEGSVFVPGVGSIHIGGLSLGEARETVARQLGQTLRGVEVNLELVQVRVFRVYLTGDVASPGAVQVSATSRVSDAAPPDALLESGSQRNVRVMRRSGETLYADLTLFQRTGRLELNPYLQDGDIVHVPPAVDFVQIRGAVAHPDRYELGPEDSLLTLFHLSGGPLPETLTQGALLISWNDPLRADSSFFDIEDVYSRVFNPRLNEGDRVYVYFTPAYHELYQASILGEVERPGTYPLILGDTRLSDLVTAAGGFRERADLSTIRLYRVRSGAQDPDPELERLSRLSRSEMTNAEYEVLRTRLAARRPDYRVDWARLRQNAELDVLVADGDVIRVDPVLATVRVEGEVRRPGLVDFNDSYSGADYIRVVGGYSDRADRRKVLVTRSVTGQTLPIADVEHIAPGDMIWVPERPDRTIWDHLQTLVAVAAQVATVVIAVRSVQ